MKRTRDEFEQEGSPVEAANTSFFDEDSIDETHLNALMDKAIENTKENNVKENAKQHRPVVVRLPPRLPTTPKKNVVLPPKITTPSQPEKRMKIVDNYNDLVDILQEATWKEMLGKEFTKPYFSELVKYLNDEAEKNKKIYPAKSNIFNALNLCSFDNVKVVILGQDPYQTPRFAHGLSFSVPSGIQVPKSLINIYKELSDDITGFVAPKHGTLTKWASSGVLLLNTVLTVEDSVSNSHKDKGWEKLTDEIIRLISSKKKNVVFMLWGRQSQDKAKMIDAKNHLILKSAHPSPLSASKGFFGCKHFSKCNEYLAKSNVEEIDWKL
jgi:uracil-DNA glycosylase